MLFSDPLFRTLSLQLDWLSERAVHVAGTKGKGTTCAITESILRHCGVTTGLYTSPHLITVRERIKINGEPIDEATFTKYFWQVWDPIMQNRDSHTVTPTWFSFLTLLAFKVFFELKIDAPVIEVGIGGRTDATNVLTRPVRLVMATYQSIFIVWASQFKIPCFPRLPVVSLFSIMITWRFSATHSRTLPLRNLAFLSLDPSL